MLSKRVKNIKTSPTLALNQKAAELKKSGRKIINLAGGEPDYDTPANIKEAGKRAIDEGRTKYSALGGIPELKDAIIKKLRSENSLEYSNSEIIVGSGAKQVIFNMLLACIDEGDHVLIPAPYWVSYPDMVKLAGGEPKFAYPSSGIKPSAADIEKAITDKTKLLILNSPNNPCGYVYTKDDYLEIANMLRKYPKLLILCDDIYEHLLFDESAYHALPALAADLRDRILLAGGVSKNYAMTGWRIGFGAGDPALIKAMGIIQSQSTSSPATMCQWAAVEAYNGPQESVAKSKAILQRRLDSATEILSNSKGIEVEKAQGAFYLFPSCKKLFGSKTPSGDVINSSADFAGYLLSAYNIVVTPSEVFGVTGHFRMSLAICDDELANGCKAIKAAAESLEK